ncbi:transporter substrate-binding domain-containing protein [Dellaglioa algida]|uniref:Amino acid ABC transporter, substrate binding protein n=1 Tax=Dellaglioa algida DSM 15638 TaxID=1423719 RepID=A0A0R1HPX9_9LACO|nr:transporter substrate-binding domain-containing protein [Dellaglioa algida]KRK45194.1 amino acid ABC transporter, substrate binding protein [Dellaglioa algida DSM 15638]MDK1733061.1 transporter substrate-binding domain-containing protein [Dellaglioa algida]MDK1734491.1 transporter substrate-binding domain-containing protein [Dellaglioa algida]
MKKILSLASVLLIALALTACGKSKESSSDLTQTKDTLTIGLEGTYRPYSYHDSDNKLTGFEVELGQQLAKKMDLKPKFVESKWDSLVAGLDANKYDVVLNNVGVTKERQAKYNFTSPYIYSKSILVVKKDNTSIKTIKDIKGKKMAQTVTSENGADAKRLGADVVSTDDFSNTISLILDGRADGTINSNDAVYSYLKEKPDTNIKTISTGSEITSLKVAGLIQKDNSKLQEKLDAALKELRADGSLSKLSKKYFGSDITNK